MQYLFALLVLVALVVCAMAQWPYYGGNYYGGNYYGGYYNTHAVAGYPYGAYGYNYAYNPAVSYLWKK